MAGSRESKQIDVRLDELWWTLHSSPVEEDVEIDTRHDSLDRLFSDVNIDSLAGVVHAN